MASLTKRDDEMSETERQYAADYRKPLCLVFHKRLCGTLANGRFHHRPATTHQPASKLEAAYHRPENPFNRSLICLPPDASRSFDPSCLKFS